MDSTKIILFFEEKLRALTSSPLFDPGVGQSIRENFELHIAQARSQPPSTRGLLKSVDKELDVVMRSFLPKAEIARIAAELKARYGFSSLGETGDIVAKRVIKRGSFKNREEAQVVRDFLLSGDYANEALPKDQTSKLEELIGQYEQRTE